MGMRWEETERQMVEQCLSWVAGMPWEEGEFGLLLPTTTTIHEDAERLPLEWSDDVEQHFVLSNN